MSDVIKTLRRYDFPEVVSHALNQLEKLCTSKFDPPPSLDIMDQIVDEFIFQQPSRKGSQKRKMSAIHELQVTEAMMLFFNQKTSSNAQQYSFKAIFSSTDRHKMDMLYKLISMAIGVGAANVLNYSAILMQAIGCSSEAVTTLSKRLVEDYFTLLPDSQSESPINKLCASSAFFTCNFITALTYVYQPQGSKTPIPTNVLKTISIWLTDDPRLCLTTLSNPHSLHRQNLWTSPTKSNTQTPTPGLVRWCIKAPLLQELNTRKLNKKPHGPTNGRGDAEMTCPTGDEDLNMVWSKIHLAVLETMLHLRTLPDASQLELLTLVDMNRAVKDLLDLYSKVKDGQTIAEDSNTQLAVDRLAQILQIALSCGAFRCSLADLRKIIQSLPHTPLIALLVAQHLSTAPPAMHNATA